MTSTRLLISKYEFIPTEGDVRQPIEITGLQEYRPGDHGGKVDEYVLRFPEGVAVQFPREYSVDSWTAVLFVLSQGFPNTPDAHIKSGIRVVWRDPVYFPRH